MRLSSVSRIGSGIRLFKGGAQAYVPKEKVTDIITFINEILEARQKGMEKSGGWFIRLKPVFDKIW